MYAQSPRLRVEQFEDRVCLSAVNGSQSLLSIASGILGQANLVQMFQNGAKTAQGLSQTIAGNNAFGHVVADAVLLGAMFDGGALLASELQVASAANAALSLTATTADVGALALAIEGIAFAAGATYGLTQDLVANSSQAVDQIVNAGQAVYQQVVNDISALNNATHTLISKLSDTVAQAVTDFLIPLQGPDKVATSAGAVDPDNDDDDDTGQSGY